LVEPRDVRKPVDDESTSCLDASTDPPQGGTLASKGTGRVPTVSAPPPAVEDEGEIARGGMGSIHRVRSARLRRREAMKILEREDSSGRMRGRFLAEAQITAQLDHPNIAPVYALHGDGTDGRSAAFTMKLVKGETLTRVLQDLEPLAGRSLERVLGIMLRVCEAVSFAHSRGVVHCDLKPDNVMVGTHGQVYVMDWGLAMLVAGDADERVVTDHEREAAPVGVVGTPAYMSPEQAWGRAEAIGPWTDVYALGAILYRVLTGRTPHGGSTPALVVEHARSSEVDAPELAAPGRAMPPELCRIAMKALRSQPHERYASVADLAADLESFLRGGGWLATRAFEKGALIVQEGDVANAAYVIVAGKCEAYKTIDGARVALREMGPGDVFGETAILTDTVRTASVVALEPTTVKVVTRDALEKELASHGWLDALVRAVAVRFREADARRK
jgi:serine/threonine-protein kinase